MVDQGTGAEEQTSRGAPKRGDGAASAEEAENFVRKKEQQITFFAQSSKTLPSQNMIREQMQAREGIQGLWLQWACISSLPQ